MTTIGDATRLSCRKQAALALIDLVAAIAPEANSIPLPNSSIAARRGSCNNDSALADLRHGTVLSGGKRPTCVF